ncbi:hypothetical protein Hanom_Chr04g00307171 [Helianthus anomalus]
MRFMNRQFGKVIHVSRRTSEDIDLSVNCVGVLIGDGNRVIDKTIIKWKDKAFTVWVEEEMADWTPECFNPDESVADEEFSSQFKFDDQHDSPVNRTEDPKEGKAKGLDLHETPHVHERSEEREIMGEGVVGSVPLGGERNNDDFSSVAPIPQEVLMHKSKDVGTQNGGGPGFINKNGVFYFNSEDGNRPIKHKERIRPRSVSLRQKGSHSPISGERPRKRNTDPGEFHFNLNLNADNLDEHQREDTSVEVGVGIVAVSDQEENYGEEGVGGFAIVQDRFG